MFIFKYTLLILFVYFFLDDSVPADDDYYTFEADGKIFTKETLMEIRQYQKTV